MNSGMLLQVSKSASQKHDMETSHSESFRFPPLDTTLQLCDTTNAREALLSLPKTFRGAKSETDFDDTKSVNFLPEALNFQPGLGSGHNIGSPSKSFSEKISG